MMKWTAQDITGVLAWLSAAYLLAAAVLSQFFYWCGVDRETKRPVRETQSWLRVFFQMLKEMPKMFWGALAVFFREMIFGHDKTEPSKVLADNHPEKCVCVPAACGNIHWHTVLCGNCRHRMFNLRCPDCGTVGSLKTCCCGKRVKSLY